MVNWNTADTAQAALLHIADWCADALKFGYGDQGEQRAFLEMAAAELNRRHGAASVQDPDTVVAVDILIACHNLDMGAENLPLQKINHDRCRALGVMLDAGGPAAWAMLNRETGETRETAREDLHTAALHEHRERGYRYERRAVLVPEPDAVAPF